MSWLSDEAVGRLRRVAKWPDFSGTRYMVTEEIGQGGMGTVYLAQDTELDRTVAIKVSNAASTHAELEARMRREARVLARLEHPGIVPIHDAGKLADGRSYYVMKRVNGLTLLEYLKGDHQLSGTLKLFERICEPVAFAHSRGIVHRDLKPENVMVGSFGEVLVLDWGVAKILEGPDSPRAPSDTPDPAAGPDATSNAGPSTGLTDPGTVMGTPGYMPPEQAFGEADSVDQRADVYALGAILFTLITGRPPPSTSSAEILARLQESKAPKRLRSIACKATARDPADRYEDAGALEADITRYRAGQPVAAHPESVLDRLARLGTTYRAALLLLAAYLIMRIVVALAAA